MTPSQLKYLGMMTLLISIILVGFYDVAALLDIAAVAAKTLSWLFIVVVVSIISVSFVAGFCYFCGLWHTV